MKLVNSVLLLFFVVATQSVSAQSFFEEGEASYYADKLQGKATASGEPYDAKIFTAAHQTLPFGTKVIVTNQNNGESVIVRINDRGPFADGRIIDLSKAAAQQIGLVAVGTAPVKLRLMDSTFTAGASATTKSQPTAPTTTMPPTTTSPAPPERIVSTPHGMTSAPTPIINSKTISANFAVQLGSFRNFDNVGTQLEKFKSYSFSDELKIYETWKDGERLYKLLVGPFETRAEAEGRMKNIKNAYGMDCFIFSVR